MSNVPISGSASVFQLYKKETTFNTAVVPDLHFGLDTSFSANLTNNINPRRGFKGSTTSGRDVQFFTYGKAEYQITENFDLNDPSIFELVLGNKTVDTYSGTDIPSSITLVNGLDHTTTDRNEVYSGALINQATISGAINEPITANLTIIAADMNFTSTLETNTPILNKAPFTFVGASFEMPAGTSINNLVESFDITINNNFTMLYGPNRKAQNYVPGERVYSIKLSTRQIDDILLQSALGGSSISNTNPTENATLKIQATRPDGDTLSFNFVLTPISTYDLSAKLNEAVGENIELTASELTITESIS